MSSGFQRFLPILPASLALAMAGAAPAAAADVWTADPYEARVTLPDPEPGTPVTGGTMACAAEAWTLTLATRIDAIVAGATGTARIVVPLGTFEAPSKAVPAGIEIAVPRAALEPLMRSTRLSMGFAGGTDEVRFPLAGSRRAITAAEALCSKVEMPVANSVPLTPYSSYLLLTRDLRRSDIEDFVMSTADAPRLRAGMVEIGGGGRAVVSRGGGPAPGLGRAGAGPDGLRAGRGEGPRGAGGGGHRLRAPGRLPLCRPRCRARGLARPARLCGRRAHRGDALDLEGRQLRAGGRRGAGRRGSAGQREGGLAAAHAALGRRAATQ